MEIEQPPAPLPLDTITVVEGDHDEFGERTEQHQRPTISDETIRAKSALGHSLPTPDDSPPRPEEKRKEKKEPIPAAKVIRLFEDTIRSARRDALQLAGSEDISEAVIPKLTLLFAHARIERIPDTVVDMIKKEEIERLSLAHNLVWNLPLRITECTHLRYLNLRSNQFRDFPKTVWKLSSLEILDISRNKLRKIPKDIRNMTSLRVFAFVHNRVDDLPTEISEMTKLQVLKTADNPLKERLRKVIEAKEIESDISGIMDTEREQAITSAIKRHLRQLHHAPRHVNSELSNTMDETPADMPKPPRRILSSRFPVVPKALMTDVATEGTKYSPSQTGPPPIPERSVNRQGSQASITYRSNLNSNLAGAERSRSNSENGSFQTALGSRPRRNMLRKEKSDLDSIDETKIIRQSHLRGFSHNSALKRNGSISSPYAGSSSPNSPRVHYGQSMPIMKRLSSLPESKAESNRSNPTIDGARGLLYSLHQVESQVLGLLAVVEANDAKRTSLEFTFYNASKWLKRLNKALDRALSMEPEDGDMLEKALTSVQQNCADCVMAYKHVIGQLQDNVMRIVADTDPRYIRTLMLTLFGSTMEVRNAMKSFGIEMKGHKREMSSGTTNPIQTIPEEFTTPQQPVRAGTPSRGRSGNRLHGGRYRSDTTIQHPGFDNTGTLQPAQPPSVPQPPGSARLPPTMHLPGSTPSTRPPSSASFVNGGSFPAHGFQSRSNSRQGFAGLANAPFSSALNTPRSGEVFNMPSPANVALRINPSTGMTEAQEEIQFEQIYHALSRSHETALDAIPKARKHFQRCLDLAEGNRQSKEIRDLWLLLVHRCNVCQEKSDALRSRLTDMPHKDMTYVATIPAGGRNDPQFWIVCKAYLQSFVDLVTDMRDAKEWRMLPAEILVLLRPVQKASRDAGKLIDASPWRHLTEGGNAISVQGAFNAQTSEGDVQRNFASNYAHQAGPNISTYNTTVVPSGHHTLYPNHPASASATSGSGAPPTTSATSHVQPYSYPVGAAMPNGASSTAPIPTTLLSAALGPAAQATIPSTPASAYGDSFFKGDVFQRADSLLSMPQAGSVNFLNRR